MAQHVSANIHFGSDFNGQLKLTDGEVAIGIAPDQARPYDLLQAALAACLHSTFLDILNKKRLSITQCHYEISGVKQDEVPTVLREVTVRVRLPRHEKEDQLRKSMEMASRYCSVFTTLSKVAQMKLEMIFE